MAEFQDVMLEWARMCNTVLAECDGSAIKACDEVCPLRENDLCAKGFSESDAKTVADAERKIMVWAAEHPGPVYPTWKEWLVEQGMIGENGVIYAKGMTRIPAYMAERMGIQPKEG